MGSIRRVSPSPPTSPGWGGQWVILLSLLLACGASEGQPQLDSPHEDREASTPAPSPQERLPPPGEAWVIFGSDTLGVELARTPEERAAGLMYRETLPAGRGMLFVFQESRIRSFWMRNTLIPLDIAYLDENLRIVDIQPMDPETEEGHPSARPAMFALEVPQGWFASRGIDVGAEAQVIFGPG